MRILIRSATIVGTLLLGFFHVASAAAGGSTGVKYAPNLRQWGSLSPNGFKQSQINDVRPRGLIIEMSSNPPQEDNDPSYGDYPLTIARTKAYSCRNSSWTPPSGGGCTTLLWDMRCTTSACGGHEPNPLENGPKNPGDDRYIRLGYSSIARAMGAMEAEIDWSTNCEKGYRGYLKWTEAVGIPDSNVYSYSDFLTAFDAGHIPYFRWKDADFLADVPGTDVDDPADIAVLPMAQACSIAANLDTHVVEIDEERADGPSETQLVSYYKSLSSITQSAGYRLSVWSDELTGSNARDSGLDANTVPQIMALPNFQYYLVKLIYDPYEAVDNTWTDQLTIIAGGTLPPQCSELMAHVGIAMQLPEMGPHEWRELNRILTGWCVPVMAPFLNGARLGGPNCSNHEPRPIPQKWGFGIGIPVRCSGNKMDAAEY